MQKLVEKVTDAVTEKMKVRRCWQPPTVSADSYTGQSKLPLLHCERGNNRKLSFNASFLHPGIQEAGMHVQPGAAQPSPGGGNVTPTAHGSPGQSAVESLKASGVRQASYSLSVFCVTAAAWAGN